MSRPALSISSQVALLRSRGVHVESTQTKEFEQFLLDVNYFRAAGYWRNFQRNPVEPTAGFLEGTSFKMLKDLYLWDSELRKLLSAGLADFEITFRSRFAHYFSVSRDPHSYLKTESHRDRIVETKSGPIALRPLLIRSASADLKRSVEPTIVSCLENGTTPPIWAAIECFSMGTVSKMYLVADEDLRYQMARSMKLRNPEIAEGLFHSLTVFRNRLAHHGRIWHHIPEYPPKVLRSLKTDPDTSIYERTPWGLIISLNHQLEVITGKPDFGNRVLEHIDSAPSFKLGLTHPRN